MTSGSHARPPAQRPAAESGHARPGFVRRAWRALHPPQRSTWTGTARRRWTWRVLTPLMVLLCGSLFAVSAVNADGTDLRAGRYTDLASLVQSEADQYEDLRATVESLTDEVDTLTDAKGDRDVKRVQAKIEKYEDPAGLVPHEGPGLRITLSDSPLDADETTQKLEYLVVHQQDIQAVVNAMWRGGATAVTVQGQRIVSTTGIKCEGNSVTLQGVPYPQPYVIEAVGDPSSLEASVDSDSYLGFYRSQSVQPDILIGWDMESEDDVDAPAYDGLLDLSYAERIDQ